MISSVQWYYKEVLFMEKRISRRHLMRGSLAAAAACSGLSYEHRALAAQLVDRSSYKRLQEPVKGLQKAQFGGRMVSRLIIGGNLISGSAHGGDLLYQSALMTHYFNSEKIFETWRIAEQNGINTTLMRADPHIFEHYQKYLKEHGGSLQWIAQTAPEQGDPVENAKEASENGAFAIYFHGGQCDGYIEAGMTDKIGGILEGFRKAGLFAGVAGHKLATIRAVEKAGLNPDFYMYTVNKVDYLSSNPEEIEAFMAGISQPWIGFKVLGAGRDRPEEGFLHAFKRGADFLAVGMFDWQVREDTAMVQAMLTNTIERQRPWDAVQSAI